MKIGLLNASFDLMLGSSAQLLWFAEAASPEIGCQSTGGPVPDMLLSEGPGLNPEHHKLQWSTEADG
jgi:hypothetical protein